VGATDAGQGGDSCLLLAAAVTVWTLARCMLHCGGHSGPKGAAAAEAAVAHAHAAGHLCCVASRLQR
jgi:hypothetical protein